MKTSRSTTITTFSILLGLSSLTACDDSGTGEALEDDSTDFDDLDYPYDDLGDEDPDAGAPDDDDDELGNVGSLDDPTEPGDGDDGLGVDDEANQDDGPPAFGWCALDSGWVAMACADGEQPCDQAFEQLCSSLDGVFVPGSDESDSTPCNDVNPLVADCDEDFISACFDAGGLFEVIETNGDGDIIDGECIFPDGIG